MVGGVKRRGKGTTASTVTIARLTSIGRSVVAALADYKGKEVQKTERALVGPIVYAFLKSLGHPSKREVHVSMLDTGKPRRIDFWVGSTKPVFIELAVRKPSGAQELMGKQNQSELSKLARANQGNVRTRYLLLIDLRGGAPIERFKLKASYDPLHAGKGKFERAALRADEVSASTGPAPVVRSPTHYPLRTTASGCV